MGNDHDDGNAACDNVSTVDCAPVVADETEGLHERYAATVRQATLIGHVWVLRAVSLTFQFLYHATFTFNASPIPPPLLPDMPQFAPSSLSAALCRIRFTATDSSAFHPSRQLGNFTIFLTSQIQTSFIVT